ncbi:hypothetical protein LAZ67_3001163 [Cordylochernes scorpioides]|uniref:Uncharacterized protein n=1 Tax=Cordylochernes scorpioides TaxID=51811 RepID=A0ABY6K6W4_9ARAC|nr:hypothetical protein LAZ67_3001163 [Cordylochernes scorpioides]
MKCEIDVCYRFTQNLLTQSLWNFASWERFRARGGAGVLHEDGGVRSSTIGRWLDYREGVSESILDWLVVKSATIGHVAQPPGRGEGDLSLWLSAAKAKGGFRLHLTPRNHQRFVAKMDKGLHMKKVSKDIYALTLLSSPGGATAREKWYASGVDDEESEVVCMRGGKNKQTELLPRRNNDAI